MYKRRETHFQGISLNEDKTYSISANVHSKSDTSISGGYYLKIYRDTQNNANKFIANRLNWVKIELPIELSGTNAPTGTTVCTSVANNNVVTFFDTSSNLVSGGPFQATINKVKRTTKSEFIQNK